MILRDVLSPVLSGVLGKVLTSVSVLALFAGGVVGVWFDPNDRSTLFQDVNATQPITAPGQTAALMRDKSGNGKHATQPTAAQRPTYGVIPYGGVRNLATASADGTNTTYWPTSASNSGITATKVATGVDTDGLPYADYAVSGTATVQSDIYLASGARRSAASVGQTYTGSLIAKLISGTPPAANSGLFPAVIGETAPTTYRENSTFVPLPPTGTDTLQTASKTFANAATNQLNCAIVIRTLALATVNYTVRIKAVQFELGSTRTAYQFNYSKYNITEPGKATVGALFTDGIDDGMVTPSIDFSGTDKVTVWAGVQKLTDAARGSVVELGANLGSAAFGLFAPSAALSGYAFSSYGSLQGIATVAGFAAPVVSVVAGISDISGDRATLQINGTQVAQSTADQGTGNYSNNPIYLFRRGGTSLPFNGIFTGLIVRGAQSSAAQISNGNTYINSTLGAY